MNKSESITNLAKALALAQAEVKNPPLDAVNPHFKNRYASLSGVRDCLTATFAKHGLSLVQSVGSGERGPRITTLLMHVSGEWLETDALEIPAQRQDAQGYGSAITYGRRYTLQAVANVVGEADDDAQAATAPPKGAAKSKAAPTPAAHQQPQEAKPDPFAAMTDHDARLSLLGVWRKGDLVKHVAAALAPGHGLPASWGEPAWKAAREAARAFEKPHKERLASEVKPLLAKHGYLLADLAAKVGAKADVTLADMSLEQLARGAKLLRELETAKA